MEYIRQVVDGDKLAAVFDIPQIFRNRKAEVIILFSEEIAEDIPKTDKRPIGFAKGAEVPDSFFKPLPEEELQLWGM